MKVLQGLSGTIASLTHVVIGLLGLGIVVSLLGGNVPFVGGHCIAVDPWFIVDSAPNEAKLISVARQVNDSKPRFVLEKISRAVEMISKSTDEIIIACLGLSFKPDIDDLRESPALEIAQQVGSMAFSKLLLVEPNIDRIPNGFDLSASSLVGLEEALTKADIVVLLVDHASFKRMDLGLLSGKQVVDTRGIWS